LLAVGQLPGGCRAYGVAITLDDNGNMSAGGNILTSGAQSVTADIVDYATEPQP